MKLRISFFLCCHYLNSFQVCDITFAGSSVFDSGSSVDRDQLWSEVNQCNKQSTERSWIVSVHQLPFSFRVLSIYFFFSITSSVGSGLFIFFFSSSFATLFSTVVHQPSVSVRKQFIVTEVNARWRKQLHFTAGCSVESSPLQDDSNSTANTVGDNQEPSVGCKS